MDKDTALDLALEALGMYQAAGFGNSTDFNKQHVAFYKAQTAITAIKQARSAPVQETVHQWRQKHSPYWYDGYPDNDDGGGPYETRTLYTTPPAQPATVQVSPLEFVTMVMEKEHLVGKPLFWAEWPNKEKNT